jgi:type VII secretion protein EccB
MGRLMSGVLRIDPDGPDQPVPRTRRGIITGLVLAAVVGIVVAVFGLIVPAGSAGSTPQAGTLVLDSDTGARYLYVDKQLRPVLNAASARLVAGGQMTVQTASTNSLRGITRGAPFGIVGAPDDVPPVGMLSGDAWSACATTIHQGSGVPAHRLVLDVGQSTPMTGLTAGEGVVVSGGDSTYLLWDGRRLRLDTGHGVVQALGYGTVRQVPVTDPFLNAVPAGPDLSPPELAGLGESGPDLAGRPSRVGQLFNDAAGRHYVLAQQGLVPLTNTQFALLSGDPDIQQQAYGGNTITTPAIGPNDLAHHMAPAGTGGIAAAAARLPAAPPRIVTVDDQRAVCVSLRPGAAAVSASVGVADTADVTAHTGPPGQGQGITPSCDGADLVAAAPGRGVLVAATAAGGGPGTTNYIVTDSGVRYPIPSSDALQKLGYSSSAAVALPAPIIGLLPSGPSLDPARLTNGGIVTPHVPPGGCAV